MHFLIKVASIRHILLVRVLVLGREAVIGPLPSKATLKRRILVESIDILLDVAGTVTHSMDLLIVSQKHNNPTVMNSQTRTAQEASSSPCPEQT
jgi:hypothetical protein